MNKLVEVILRFTKLYDDAESVNKKMMVLLEAAMGSSIADDWSANERADALFLYQQLGELMQEIFKVGHRDAKSEMTKFLKALRHSKENRFEGYSQQVAKNTEEITFNLLQGKTVTENFESILNFKKLSVKDKVQLIGKGITKKQLENFISVTELKWDRLATLLTATERTLYNAKKGTINRNFSDRFIYLVDFYCHLYNLNKNRQMVNQQLSRPCEKANNQIPLDLMAYTSGLEHLRDVVFNPHNQVS